MSRKGPDPLQSTEQELRGWFHALPSLAIDAVKAMTLYMVSPSFPDRCLSPLGASPTQQPSRT